MRVKAVIPLLSAAGGSALGGTNLEMSRFWGAGRCHLQARHVKPAKAKEGGVGYWNKASQQMLKKYWPLPDCVNERFH